MNGVAAINRFYLNMGLLLLVLVFLGFGLAALSRGTNPADMPILMHLHGFTYIAWFGMFVLQANLIGKNNRGLHKKLGYSSVAIVGSMLITGFMMAAYSYDRGVSPIPNMTVQQFLVFPLIDLLGLILFFGFAVLNRNKPLVHKHCMLMACIAIMDPAIARLAVELGAPPAALIIHLALVGLVIIHDRRIYNKVHLVTWIGLSWVFLRVIIIFSIGASDTWQTLMDGVFS
jgi:hypothetical protein